MFAFPENAVESWERGVHCYLFSKREVSLQKQLCWFSWRVVVWINFLLLLFETRSVSKSLLKNWIWYIVYTEVEAVINPAGVKPFVSQKGAQASETASAAAVSVTLVLLPETQLLEKAKKNLRSTSNCMSGFSTFHVDQIFSLGRVMQWSHESC